MTCSLEMVNYECWNFEGSEPAVRQIKIKNIKLINQILNITDKKNSPKTNLNKAGFNDNNATISINGRICQLSPQENEHCFCRIMFKHPVGKIIGWEDCYKEITGDEPTLETNGRQMSPEQRKVYDTVKRINGHIRIKCKISENIFYWKNKTVKRLK